MLLPDIHVHVHVGSDDEQLDRIEHKLDLVLQGEMTMALDLSGLQQAVEQDTAVTSSAITLLQTLADELRAAAGDPAAVQAIADQITGNAQALADAVAANTPAAPAPPEEPGV